MITERKTALRPILESSEGLHLTAYLVNRGDLADLQRQLREVIEEAYEWLYPVQLHEERKRFLQPLYNLLEDGEILRGMRGNIGLFRNEDLFRVLNIPIDVQTSCQVATSFHVKPLLRWFQGDEEFLLLGVESDSVSLYMGSQHSFKLIDSFAFDGPTAELTKRAEQETIDEEAFTWVVDWVNELTKHSQPKLFFAGDDQLTELLVRKVKFKYKVRSPIATVFTRMKAMEICCSIRQHLKAESMKDIEKSLLEFRFAEESDRARKNIFEISKAVVQGKVRKLIVTDDLNIFGKIDKKSGMLSIHPTDMDHEDDCILDDLAQMVLKQGGEVVLAKREEIPKGRPILAILDEECEEAPKTASLRGEAQVERYA